jgi:LPXTG-motif cell wall-anchored protein
VPSTRPNFPGDAPSQRAGGLAATDAGTPWWQFALAGAAAMLLAVLGFGYWRRRRGGRLPALAELERALRRTGRAPGPGTTLRSLEHAFARTPAAAEYIRVLRDARYGGRPAAPTPSQRRALRAELKRGAGMRGRVRAWWALPPRG